MFRVLCVLSITVIAHGSVFPSDLYRLPRSVLPRHYDLTVISHINDDEGFKFTGKVEIKVSRELIFQIS